MDNINGVPEANTIDESFIIMTGKLADIDIGGDATGFAIQCEHP